jgi:hypothetical protein
MQSTFMGARAACLAACAAGLLGGCASTAPSPGAGGAAGAPPAPDAQAAKFTEAATAPLSDLNLVRAKIPPVLSAAQKAPYAVPTDASCNALAGEVTALDAALGPDLDAPASTEHPSLLERGGEAAGDAAAGALRNTAEGVIPFRGWVRKLTGAERYAKEVNAAIAAGGVRRAYLKGLGHAAGCLAPAAPRS